MAFTQKYAIISPIEPISIGQTFESTNWPLHVTLADTFAINVIDEDLLLQLGSLAKDRCVKVVGERASRFGKNADVDVMLLRPSNELFRLHTDIVDLLLSKGAVFNDPQYIKSGFIGHITQRTNRRVDVNETVNLESIALIDMFPGANPYQRRVVNKINFKEE